MSHEILDKEIEFEIKRIINGLNNPPDFDAFINNSECPYCYNQSFHVFGVSDEKKKDQLYICEKCHSIWVLSFNKETGTCRILNMEDILPGSNSNSSKS
jgi:hypothetical protein